MAWAEHEFAPARLGDSRRNRRLVGIAARAAEHPNGVLTEVFADHAAAYDFL
jgi:transposase-like protein